MNLKMVTSDSDEMQNTQVFLDSLTCKAAKRTRLPTGNIIGVTDVAAGGNLP